MTDTGQVPGEGLPENADGQQGAPDHPAPSGPVGPDQSGHAFHDHGATAVPGDHQQLMPDAQGWGDQYAGYPAYPQEAVHPQEMGYQPYGAAYPHEAAYRQEPGLPQEAMPPGPMPGGPEHPGPGDTHDAQGGYVPGSLPQEQVYASAPYAAAEQGYASGQYAAYEQAYASGQHAGTEQPYAQDQQVSPVVPHQASAPEQFGGASASAQQAPRQEPAGGTRTTEQAAPPQRPAAQVPPARRPLHFGPPVPESTGGTGGVVRSLSDRGPAHPTPPPGRQAGPPTLGPEYLDVQQFPVEGPSGTADLDGRQAGAVPGQPVAWAPEQIPAPEVEAEQGVAAPAPEAEPAAPATAPEAGQEVPAEAQGPMPPADAEGTGPDAAAQQGPVAVPQDVPTSEAAPASDAGTAPVGEIPAPAGEFTAPAPEEAAVPETAPETAVPEAVAEVGPEAAPQVVAEAAPAPVVDEAAPQVVEPVAEAAEPVAEESAPEPTTVPEAPVAESPDEAEAVATQEPAAVPETAPEAVAAQPAPAAAPESAQEPEVAEASDTAPQDTDGAEAGLPVDEAPVAAEPEPAEAQQEESAPVADAQVPPEPVPGPEAEVQPEPAEAPEPPEQSEPVEAEAAQEQPVPVEAAEVQEQSEPAPAGETEEETEPAEATDAPEQPEPAQVPQAQEQPEPAAADAEVQPEPAQDTAVQEQPAPEAELPEQAAEPAGDEGEVAADEAESALPEPAVADAEPAPADESVPAQEPAAAPETPPAEAAPAATDPEAADEPAPETPAEDAAAPEAPDGAQAPDEDATPAEAEASDQEQAPAPGRSGFDEAEREAVLRVIRERRDIRNGFRPDPVPHDVLRRVLEAAHTAPSVGHSQPWDFVVIRSAETRQAVHELAARQREAYAKSLPKGRAKQFKSLKVEAILETPVNIVVTADPTRGGRHTLGRQTQPQMAPYSSALAVENLWLAARAEGLGVGWVSFFDERELVRELGLPEHLEVVAYLCVGYVDEFPDEPELVQTGWSRRRPLSWVVHEETYGRRALPGEQPHDLLAETLQGIRPLDAKALGEAWERQKRMTKPAGALGMLEIISAQLCGLSRKCPPPVPEPAAVAVFAGDHGVHAQGVTPWPQEVTAQMVANFLDGGAVCNAFASQVGAEVCVVDVGVASELPARSGLLPRKVRAGTGDFTEGPALTREEVLRAVEVGVETARDLVAAGNKALVTGEMGIANTTVSAALISVYTGLDPAEVTGRGTGINDETHARKVDVVRAALELHQPDASDPIGVLAAVGGLEHAALVGLLLGGASLRTPVILDGVSAGAAALVARAVAPEVLAACIAGHRSAEPGHVAALTKLGLRPLVDLDLRLGEGTGALLALPIVQSAARAMHEVATFDSAGVTEKG